MKTIFIKKNANYNGDNQAFSEIGTSDDLKKWLEDGSIEAGDIIGDWRPISQAVEKKNIYLQLINL